MPPPELDIKETKKIFAITLILVLALLAHQGYPLLLEPPETVELLGVYEGIEEIINYSKTGSSKSYYLKIRGLDALVWPTNDKQIISRLRRTHHNNILKLVLEKEPRTRWFGKPERYYRAVAIYANNRIYDHQKDPLAGDRKQFKHAAIILSICLALFGLSLHMIRLEQSGQ